MTTVGRRGAVALTAAAALAIGLVPAALTTSSILASGEGPTTLAPAAVPVGQMRLTTSSGQGTVTWDGMTETFTGGQQCEIVWTDGSPTLLDLTGAGSTDPTAVAGFRDGQIGVYEPSASGAPENAAQCFRVDFGSFTDFETLRLSLGSNPALTDTFGSTASPILVSRASVTYAVQSQSGSIDIRDAAGQAVSTSSSPTWGPKTKSGTRYTVDLTPSSPTSAFSLTARSGSFNLVGATFDLVSQRDATFCNPGNPAGGTSTYTEGATTVNYLGNADSSDSCFAVSLTSGGRQYTFRKPLDVSIDAQFVFDHTWTLPVPATPDFALPKAYADFELTSAPQPREMLFCPDWLYTDGALALVTDAARLALLKALDMEADDPEVPGSLGTQFACIDRGSRTTRIDPDGLKVEDKVFLIGDVKMYT